MPVKTKRNNRTRKNKTSRGGMLKGFAAATALASGVKGNTALGKGMTLRGVGPWGMNRPHPARNVAGLSVLPVNGTPSYMVNRAYPKGPLYPTNLAGFKGWPNSGPGFVESNSWHNRGVNKGTRYASEPEIQTWNPYLRGDPEEVVDYYEGFSNADKAARMATNGDGGKVKRKNTPMWKAAMRHSVKLPAFKSASNYNSDTKLAKHGEMQQMISDNQWEKWAEDGRKLGMNIPINDPRRATKPNAKWANVPHTSPDWFLGEQLYHHGQVPKTNLWGQPRMKGNRAFPEPNWSGSNLGKKQGPKTEWEATNGANYRGPNTGI